MKIYEMRFEVKSPDPPFEVENYFAVTSGDLTWVKSQFLKFLENVGEPLDESIFSRAVDSPS